MKMNEKRSTESSEDCIIT